MVLRNGVGQVVQRGDLGGLEGGQLKQELFQNFGVFSVHGLNGYRVHASAFNQLGFTQPPFDDSL